MNRDLTEIRADIDRIRRDIVRLSEITSPEELGYTRISFSKQDVDAREYAANVMRNEAQLSVRIDAAGNLIGRKDGKMEGPAILIGSHIDTVRGGGRFDGIAGVIAGIEVVRQLETKGIRTIHPLEIIVFTAEEPSPYGISTVGSRGMSGKLSKDLLESMKDSDGRTLGEAIKWMGGDPENIHEAQRSPEEILAYLELHIEQGPFLFDSETPIGVVTGISGIYRGKIEVIGKSDHAGTVPMEARRDALAAASEVILALENICQGLDDVVGTIGNIKVFPNSYNVVPGTVTLVMEIRSLIDSRAEAAMSLFKKALQEIQERRDIRVSFEEGIGSAPVIFEAKMVEGIRDACKRLHIAYREMASGAGHDASHMASLGPTGMVFIPSKDGRSHCPEEWSEFEHVGLGTDVLTEAIILIDREGSH